MESSPLAFPTGTNYRHYSFLSLLTPYVKVHCVPPAADLKVDLLKELDS